MSRLDKVKVYRIPNGHEGGYVLVGPEKHVRYRLGECMCRGNYCSNINNPGMYDLTAWNGMVPMELPTINK